MTVDPQALPKEQLAGLLQGRGIEIGALHRPLPAPHLDVRYADEMSTPEMLERYPELREANPVDVEIVDDGATLASVADESQDFVIASHLIEHLPNPIGGLLNWQRILRPGGRLFLAVPDKEQTFDRPRSITPNEHLLEDWSEPSEARDFAHFLDFSLEVSCKQYDAAPVDRYEDYAKHLVEIDYSIHYHVWDIAAFRDLLSWLPGRVPEYRLKPVAESGVLDSEFCFVLEK